MTAPDSLRAPRGKPARAQGKLQSILAVAWLSVLELLVVWRLTPPAVRPVDAPASEFSAARAEQVLSRLLPTYEPHPAGTVAQAEFRARLILELDRLGLDPEVQSGIACSAEGTCAELHNVVGRVRGALPTWEVALMAHYDSVPAGPGAGDDAQGVASVIEIARGLQALPPRAGVLLVFSDGEELGLLGARLFVDEHPASRDVRVALNLEARGNRGPSLMFETTPGSAWLVGRYASAPRPVASSLFATVYGALPNDTDLSVLKTSGAQGLNFAFVGGVEHYHTSRDVRASLDLRSVQQQGAAALATVREISERGVEPAGGELVFFDLLSACLVRLPAGLMAPAAGLALALFGLCIASDLRRDRGYGSELGRAGLGLLVAWSAPTLAAALIGWLLTLLGALPFPIVAEPWPLLSGLLLLAGGGSSLALGLTSTPRGRRALFDATWLSWASIGALLAICMPPVSYLLVLPSLIAALARLALRFESPRRLEALVMLACATAAALLCFPPLTLLHTTLGFSSTALLALAFSIGVSPFAPALEPLLGGRRTRVALCAGGLCLALTQLTRPTYSSEVPQRLALVLEVDAAGEARWLADSAAGPLPPRLRAAAAFSPRPARLHPWPGHGQTLMYVAKAKVDLEGATPVSLEPVDAKTLRLSSHAPEALWALGVRMPRSARLASVSWRGRHWEPKAGEAWTDAGNAAELGFAVVPGRERFISLDLTFDGALPRSLELIELRRGLPSAARELESARGAAAVTSGLGDLTVLRTATNVAHR